MHQQIILSETLRRRLRLDSSVRSGRWLAPEHLDSVSDPPADRSSNNKCQLASKCARMNYCDPNFFEIIRGRSDGRNQGKPSASRMPKRPLHPTVNSLPHCECWCDRLWRNWQISKAVPRLSKVTWRESWLISTESSIWKHREQHRLWFVLFKWNRTTGCP